MDSKSMIYIDGGSNTFGDELEDQGQAWPYVLAKMLDRPVVNRAIKGKSNQRIVFDIVNFCSKQSPELVVIGWVNIHRKMFFRRERNLIVDISPSGQNSIFHNNSELKNFQKLLYAYWGNFVYDAWQFLHNIVLVQNFLKSKNIPYFMFNDSDQTDLLKLLTITSESVTIKEKLLDFFDEVNDDQISEIQQDMNSIFKTIDHGNFYDFSWHLKRMVKFTGHPSVENHQTIADFFLPLIHNYYDTN